VIGALLCAVAFAISFVVTRRRLVSGVVALVSTGYAYGIVRARVHDGASHFIFDAALLGLYAAHFSRHPSPEDRGRSSAASTWTKLLFVMPFVLFLLPIQHPLIQLVGLRAAVLFLPMIVVGARLRADDVAALGRALAVLNLVAFAFAAAEWVFGIEPFVPHNAVTDIIYRSTDVGAARAHRIPSTFPSAHAYAGTMLATLPLLAAAWPRAASARRRALVGAAIAAAVLGVFASGARTPALILLVFAAAVFLDPRASARLRFGVLVLGLVLAAAVLGNERLQRFTTVSDVATVETRFQGSNVGLGEVVLSYPLGAGLGRAVGTSIPFFLDHLAEPQIGLENEYSRIIVDQGLAGGALWILFVVWVLRRRAPAPSAEWALPYRLLRWHVALLWLTGLIGTGLLLSIPQSPLLLLQMGLLSAAAMPVAQASPELAWRRHWGRVA
jgi:hypothetical protein